MSLTRHYYLVLFMLFQEFWLSIFILFQRKLGFHFKSNLIFEALYFLSKFITLIRQQGSQYSDQRTRFQSTLQFYKPMFVMNKIWYFGLKSVTLKTITLANPSVSKPTWALCCTTSSTKIRTPMFSEIQGKIATTAHRSSS